MNTILRLTRIACIATLGVMAISCSDDDNDNDSENSLLVEAQSRTNLTTFVEALERADLDGNLEGSGELTVFAPTNTAFVQFMGENGYATLDDIPVEILRELLLNHAMSGSVETGEMLTGYRKTMARGAASNTNFLDMYIDTSTGYKINGISTIITPNVDATNGTLHLVDRVIEMPSIMTFVRAKADLSSLKNALALHPESEFVAEMEGTGENTPYTLFAPTNTAFSDYLTENNLASLDLLSMADVQTTLRYHLGTMQNSMASSFFDNQSFDTWAGQHFTINLTGGGKKIVDANSRIANITTTDIQAYNGIIHLVDKVLMPNL